MYVTFGAQTSFVVLPKTSLLLRRVDAKFVPFCEISKGNCMCLMTIELERTLNSKTLFEFLVYMGVKLGLWV
jgi:hypothetical protein